MSTREQITSLREAIVTTINNAPPVLVRLEEVTETLISFYRELAQLTSAEKQGRVEAFFNSQETSLGAREKEGEYRNLNTTSEILITKGEIAAYEAERDFLVIYLGELRGAKDAGPDSHNGKGPPG